MPLSLSESTKQIKKTAPIERSGREAHKLDFVEIFSVIVDKVQHFYEIEDGEKSF
jgi:hypothetical protein